jgi:putative hydrolase of the HAD superfamily
MRTILFDFGNVIGDFDHRRAIRQWLPHCDLTEEAIFAAIYGADLEDAFEAGRLTGAEFVRRACDVIGYRGTAEQFRAAFVDIFTPNPDVCALVPRLKRRHRLVLASNTNELHSAYFRETFADVLRHFDAVGLSHEAGARKPHRAFFEHCQTLAGGPPQECLFIDDLPANVEAARAFGWRAVQYTTYPELERRLRALGIDV